ncbi:MAG: DUF5714 domain-containing protein [Thermoplasmata archaeon]
MKKKAKGTFYWDEFHAITNGIKGITDEDINRIYTSVKRFILESNEKDPVKLYHAVFDEIESIWDKDAPFPLGGAHHHYIVPGVILSSLRNCGYEIESKDIEKGMLRGSKLAAHSCGFTGISGAAHSVGIIASVVGRITPMHDERREVISAAAHTFLEISGFERRCCKRSNYAAIANAVNYLASKSYKLPSENIECRFFSGNAECSGSTCPYFPSTANSLANARR